MVGSVSKLAMVEKSIGEKLGPELGLGFVFGCGREQGTSGGEGHLMMGLPRTESHDWLEKNRGERERRWRLGFGLKRKRVREKNWRGL